LSTGLHERVAGSDDSVVYFRVPSFSEDIGAVFCEVFIDCSVLL